MNVFILWFNEWEANCVLGVFETQEQAERWKRYFIVNPTETNYNGDMIYYSKRDNYEDRFVVQECELGKLNSVRLDNLKYVEHLITENENASKIDGTEPTQG